MAKHAPKPTREGRRFCTQCLVEKPFAEYRVKDEKPYNQCLVCEARKSKECRAANPAHSREICRKSRERNRDVIRKRQRDRYQNDPAVRERNLAKSRAYNKSEHGKENTKRWREANSERMRLYYRNKRKNDPLHKTACNLRNRIYGIMRNKGLAKNMTYREYLGCTPEFLLKHLEAQFQPGMTWDNYGEWHIDHIIPLASATTEQEVYKLCHHTNLQPLWAVDNHRKSDRLDWTPE